MPGGYVPLTFTRTFWRRFCRNRLAHTGLAVLFLLYGMALLAPLLATQSYDAINSGDRFLGPSAQYWLGTDHLGRDIWSRIVWGSRVSLTVGFVSAGVAISVGTTLGALAGYFGGWVDVVISRFTEIVVSMPQFFLLLALAAVIPRSIWSIMLIIGLTSWPSIARIVRGEVLSLRERDFAEAARAVGATDMRIIFRQILPNAMAPVIVSTTLRIGHAILAESGLSFLGLGTPPPYPSWGSIVAGGKDYLRTAPWICLAPGLFIFLTVLSFNCVGDGLRDALDPRLKR
ncbi:MAG TPA: ABC transporter permease [Symbiobacteriaceae bacterium]|nr:ABC transporter permease [Symbiobacteriaceae bacterium]